MDYKIVICSHKRIEILQKKTLQTLQKYNIPKDKIFIFVAADELIAYQQAFPTYQIRQGALGLAANRNAASQYFLSDEYLFWLDDDIKGFYHNQNGKTRQISDLDSVIRQGFELANKHTASLWGLYPVCQARWMSDTISVGLVFCYGCAHGTINKKDIVIEKDLKEDYERCLKYYARDNVVIRLNWVAPYQSYRKGSGGLSEVRTLAKEKEECLALLQAYPDKVKVKFKPDGTRYDLLFYRPLCHKENRV